MKKNTSNWKEIGRRCKSVMKERNILQRDASLGTDLPQSVISAMWNGARDPLRLANFLSSSYGISMDFLMNGNGVASLVDIRPADDPELQEYAVNNSGTKFYKDGNKILMEVPKVQYNVLGSQDDDFAILERDRENMEKVLFDVDNIHHGKYFAFEVDGNSMDDGTERGFRKGDIVLVRELDRGLWKPKLHIGKWPFWVVVFGNNVRLKQIVAQDENMGTITLHSLNPSPEYTDFTLHLNEVQRLFSVVKKKPREVSYGGF